MHIFMELKSGAKAGYQTQTLGAWMAAFLADQIHQTQLLKSVIQLIKSTENINGLRNIKLYYKILNFLIDYETF